jgi:hypothetical protein
LFLDVPSVEVEENDNGHDEGNAMDKVSSGYQLAATILGTYQIPRTMARVIVFAVIGLVQK